jgi:hypothetical protein
LLSTPITTEPQFAESNVMQITLSFLSEENKVQWPKHFYTSVLRCNYKEWKIENIIRPLLTFTRIYLYRARPAVTPELGICGLFEGSHHLVAYY